MRYRITYNLGGNAVATIERHMTGDAEARCFVRRLVGSTDATAPCTATVTLSDGKTFSCANGAERPQAAQQAAP